MTTKLAGWAGFSLGMCRHKNMTQRWGGHIVCFKCGLLHCLAGVDSNSLPVQCECGWYVSVTMAPRSAMLCSLCCRDMNPMMHTESLQELVKSKQAFTGSAEKLARIAVAATSLLAIRNTTGNLTSEDAERLWDMIAKNSTDLDSLGINVSVRLPE